LQKNASNSIFVIAHLLICDYLIEKFQGRANGFIDVGKEVEYNSEVKRNWMGIIDFLAGVLEYQGSAPLQLS
jgi:hypothetical protein